MVAVVAVTAMLNPRVQPRLDLVVPMPILLELVAKSHPIGPRTNQLGSCCYTTRMSNHWYKKKEANLRNLSKQHLRTFRRIQPRITDFLRS